MEPGYSYPWPIRRHNRRLTTHSEALMAEQRLEGVLFLRGENRHRARMTSASGGQVTLATRHRIIVRLSLLLLIGQVACAAGSPSVPEAYHGNRNSGSEQNIYKSEPSPPALEQSEAILEEKAGRTPAQRKISSQLLYVVKMHMGELKNGDRMRYPSVKVDSDGTTVVDVKAQVTEAVLAQIGALGGKVLSSFPQYKAIRARIPLDQIEALAEMPEVTFIRPAAEAITR